MYIIKDGSEVRKLYFQAGEAPQGFSYDFAKVIYDNCEVFQHRNFDEFYIHTFLLAQDTDRWEYIAYNDEGEITASMAFFLENDQHVGKCLSVLLAYSTDPKALIGGYRWLYEVAKSVGAPFVCYTKEVKPLEYSMIYRRVKA